MVLISIQNKYDEKYVNSTKFVTAYILRSATKYKGQWSGHVKQGRGTLKWTDGSRYDGYWFNDMANGHGRLIMIGRSFTLSL